jgi:hypothetical protein
VALSFTFISDVINIRFDIISSSVKTFMHGGRFQLLDHRVTKADNKNGIP